MATIRMMHGRDVEEFKRFIFTPPLVTAARVHGTTSYRRHIPMRSPVVKKNEVNLGPGRLRAGAWERAFQRPRNKRCCFSTNSGHGMYHRALNPPRIHTRKLGPAVIYLDEVEKYFTGKKKGGDGAARFKKDLVTYANSLKPEEHVVLVGCTNQPWSIPDGELKDVRNVFEKHLYLPFASYASRVMLWKRAIAALLAPTGHQLPDEFDISTLAQISEGYSAGSILHAAKRTLNTRRVERAEKRPFAESEFLSALSRCPRTYGDDNVKFRNFTAVITGLKLRRDKLKAALAGDDGGDGKGKKGGKGKKKKKK